MQFPSPLVKLVDITSLLNHLHVLSCIENKELVCKATKEILSNLSDTIRMFAEIDLANVYIDVAVKKAEGKNLHERAEAQQEVDKIKRNTDETIKKLSASFEALKNQFPLLINPLKVQFITQRLVRNFLRQFPDELRECLNPGLPYLQRDIMFTDIIIHDNSRTVLEPINQVEQLIGNALLMPYQLQNQLMKGQLMQGQLQPHNQQLSNIR
jgi:hypothetical protein